MRRTAPIVIGCALILLLGVAEAIASDAGPPSPPNSKNTGPAVNGTILISGPVPGTFGTFAIRLVKGTLQSGAMVISTRVIHYGQGCTIDPAVIANRFLGGPSMTGGLLSQYFDDSAVLTEIFAELGLTIGVAQPIITDVNNAVCSPNNSTGALSLDVTIQFNVPK